MMRYLLSLLAFGMLFQSTAQIASKYEFNASLPVLVGPDTLLNGFTGSFNSPIFSTIDYNHDGLLDLFIYERESRKAKSYINTGSAYEFTTAYDSTFQSLNLRDGAILKDYNCDGTPDLWDWNGIHVRLFKGEFLPNNQLTFQLMSSVLTFPASLGPINISFPLQDLPAIEDIDGDGDVDILAFGSASSIYANFVSYYENKSMDLYGTCDSIAFENNTLCWGGFFESAFNNQVFFPFTCKPVTDYSTLNSGVLRHAGSSLLAIDLDNDSDKDLIMGDIGYPTLKALYNGGDSISAVITAADSVFPNYDVITNLDTFPAPYYFDADFDGVKDLIVSNCYFGLESKNYDNVWYYKNRGTNSTPLFEFKTTNFLIESTIDVGTGSHPTLVDVTGDGLNDLVIGNFGYYQPAYQFKSTLTVYQNIGTATNPIFEFLTDDFSNLSTQNFQGVFPAFGDLNNDGTIDLILGDISGNLHYFRNTALPNSPADFQVEELNLAGIDVGQYAAPALFDVNQDGLLDLVVGEKNGNLNYFENTGSASNPAFSSTPTNANFGGVNVTQPYEFFGYSTPVLVQPNDSLETYLFCGSNRGTIYMYNNIEGNTNGTFNLTDSIVMNTMRTAPGVGDLREPNRKELVIGEQAGGVYLYMNNIDSLPEDTSTNVFVRVVNSVAATYQIFPNPAENELTITSDQANTLQQIEVLSIEGKVLLVSGGPKNGSKATLRINSINPGLYFLRLTSTNGQIQTKRFVKK